MPFKVLIIGSGLSGTLLANGLKKHNISYTLYERSPDPSSSSPPQRTGYQIRLGAPALDAFRRCLTPNVKATICARFGRGSASAPILYGKSMGVFVDLTRLPSYPKSAPVNRVVLRDALAEEVDVVYGKAFVRYEVVSGENGGKERIKVFFEDWTEDVGDLLVAADGSGSKVGLLILLPFPAFGTSTVGGNDRATANFTTNNYYY
jgi:2-polyprenyl-6-methoxyphenol hydroxylase-like FAD-dependent oxidoreductase